jgi:hypothetical protein
VPGPQRSGQCVRRCAGRCDVRCGLPLPPDSLGSVPGSRRQLADERAILFKTVVSSLLPAQGALGGDEAVKHNQVSTYVYSGKSFECGVGRAEIFRFPCEPFSWYQCQRSM